MNSMTGFGRGEAEKDGRRITIEIKTVNHRYLDINLRTPRVLLPLEEYARSEIKKRLARGRVEVFVNYKNTSDAVGEIRADLALAQKYAKAAAEIAGAVGMEQQLPLDSLMRALQKNSYLKIFSPAFPNRRSVRKIPQTLFSS